MPARKSPAQLDAEIARALKPKSTTKNAKPHVDAIHHAIYASKDPKALVAAVDAANKHAARMKKIARKPPNHPGSSALVDESGNYDASMYELANLLVDANARVKRIKALAKK